MAQSYTVRRRAGIDPRTKDKWEIVGHYVNEDGSTSIIPIGNHATRTAATLCARFIAGHGATVTVEE